MCCDMKCTATTKQNKLDSLKAISQLTLDKKGRKKEQNVLPTFNLPVKKKKKRDGSHVDHNQATPLSCKIIFTNIVLVLK